MHYDPPALFYYFILCNVLYNENESLSPVLFVVGIDPDSAKQRTMDSIFHTHCSLPLSFLNI
jgi:hypothetical protein